MKTSYHLIDDICVISFDSNLQVVSKEDIDKHVYSIFNKEKYEAVIFNLENVKAMDSSGIGFIASILKFLNSSEIKFALCRLKPLVNEILEMANLKKVCKVYKTEKEAITKIKEQ